MKAEGSICRVLSEGNAAGFAEMLPAARKGAQNV